MSIQTPAPFEETSEPSKGVPRRAPAWAKPVRRLDVAQVTPGIVSANVEGRRVVGPLQGFGQLWQKTYRVRLSGARVSPFEVVEVWKRKFSTFWPRGSWFYPPIDGIVPGGVAVLNLAGPGGMPVYTGMLVIYVDNLSFTLMTPEGHVESGWITFSAYEEDGATVAQVESFARATDPLFELCFLLFAHRYQENFWRQTLEALAAHFGVKGYVQMRKTCLDPQWHWSELRNVRYNAAIGSAIHLARVPIRWAKETLRRCRGV